MKIYVASSWRNDRQPEVVAALRSAGHEVYDFRNPAPGRRGFKWAEIDPDWEGWDAVTFREALRHPIANAGFAFDMNALGDAEAVVLVLPCGRSAHLELGFAAGAGKLTLILLDGQNEPELMYKMATAVATSIGEMIRWLDNAEVLRLQRAAEKGGRL